MAFQTPEQHDREGAASALDVILHMTRQIDHAAYLYSEPKGAELATFLKHGLVDIVGDEYGSNGEIGGG